MSGGKTRKPESSFDVGVAGVSGSEPERRERTAEEKAVGARTIAENLDNHDNVVIDSVTAMEIAAAAEDRAGWTTAKQAADAGVVQIRELAAAALAADATDVQVRERLAGVEVLLAAAEQRVTDARAQICQGSRKVYWVHSWCSLRCSGSRGRRAIGPRRRARSRT
jgi:hypothetical protein